MSARDDAWAGLWHAMPPGAGNGWLRRLALYLLVPVALALLFGRIRSAREFGVAYLGAFLVGGCVAGGFEVAYHFVWPRIVHRRPGWPARIAGHAVTMIAAVGVGSLVASALVQALLGWHADLPRLALQSAVVATVVVTLLVVVDEMHARARELERQKAEHRALLLRAELAALQARTDPHFLFNSLNTVAALIPDDPALAESLLERLATVFRYALDGGRRDAVLVTEEVAAVTAYLEVEALRLGDRLRWRIDTDPVALAGVHVPPLVLQPLVENAVRHGAGGRRGATEIVVSVARTGDELVLAVEDHAATTEAVAAAPAGAGGTGTALRDLRARLELAYGGRARLAAGVTARAGWRAEVVVPLALVEPA
jgi:two-component system, LytTR family, sensor histidine kinase AlgZ